MNIENIKEKIVENKKIIVAGTIISVSTIAFVGLNFNHGDKSEAAKPTEKVEDKIEADKIEEELNAQKTKSNNSSNELVPYNLNGRLGSLGRYNSTPLSLGGGYNYTPTLEPTVYEPIIEPVKDEVVEEFEEPIVNEVVNEVEKEVPVERPQGGVSEEIIVKDEEAPPLTGGTSEEVIEKDEEPTTSFETPSTPNNNGGVSEEVIDKEEPPVIEDEKQDGSDVALPPQVSPPVTPPPEIIPPLIPIPDVPNNGGGVSEEVIEQPIMVVPIEGRNVDDLVQEIKEKEFNGREDIRVEIVDDMIYFYEVI